MLTDAQGIFRWAGQALGLLSCIQRMGALERKQLAPRAVPLARYGSGKERAAKTPG